jgi:hypothetical protein
LEDLPLRPAFASEDWYMAHRDSGHKSCFCLRDVSAETSISGRGGEGAGEKQGARMTHPSSKPPLSSVRNQAALVRTLLDELEALSPRFDPARVPSAQAIDELTRLGCRILEAAAILSSAEEAQRVPHLTKCLPAQIEAAQIEADRVAVESASNARAAADGGRG